MISSAILTRQCLRFPHSRLPRRVQKLSKALCFSSEQHFASLFHYVAFGVGGILRLYCATALYIAQYLLEFTVFTLRSSHSPGDVITLARYVLSLSSTVVAVIQCSATITFATALALLKIAISFFMGFYKGL